MREEFNKYVKDFKKLPLKEKQQVAFDQLKMLAVATHTLCKEINAKNELLVNEELSDVEKGHYSEDDFAEAIMVLTNSIQNSISDFHLKLSEIINEIK